jgi:hypothetical protein
MRAFDAAGFAAKIGTGARATRGRTAARPAGGLGEVRELAGLELRRLRAAGAASTYERRQLLDDLGTRLAALLGELAAAGGDRELTESVRRLVDAVRGGGGSGGGGGGGDLDELWEQALRVLERLAGPAGATAPDPAAPPARGPFWKR